MKCAILFETDQEFAINQDDPKGVKAMRLLAVQTWLDTIAPGQPTELFHNRANTQTFAAVGFPPAYFSNFMGSTIPLDLHDLREHCIEVPFACINLQTITLFTAIWMDYLNTQYLLLEPNATFKEVWHDHVTRNNHLNIFAKKWKDYLMSEYQQNIQPSGGQAKPRL